MFYSIGRAYRFQFSQVSVFGEWVHGTSWCGVDEWVKEGSCDCPGSGPVIIFIKLCLFLTLDDQYHNPELDSNPELQVTILIFHLTRTKNQLEKKICMFGCQSFFCKSVFSSKTANV